MSIPVSCVSFLGHLLTAASLSLVISSRCFRVDSAFDSYCVPDVANYILPYQNLVTVLSMCEIRSVGNSCPLLKKKKKGPAAPACTCRSPLGKPQAFSCCALGSREMRLFVHAARRRFLENISTAQLRTALTPAVRMARV